MASSFNKKASHQTVANLEVRRSSQLNSDASVETFHQKFQTKKATINELVPAPCIKHPKSGLWVIARASSALQTEKVNE